jgi:hypothetical protein
VARRRSRRAHRAAAGTDWGMRSCALRDPDDNEIGIGSPISTDC